MGDDRAPGDAAAETAASRDHLQVEAGTVHAFLIADVRGYTRFTQDKGDEAAAALARDYATLVREVVGAAGGRLIELRGDEALAMFDSPRQAIRASMSLRGRLIDETLAHPDRPLPVGVGIDVGEAVPVEDGYRGGALNVAARLCSAAGPGEVLASREAAHLARKVEGVRYTELGRLQLKGLARTIGAVRVEPEAEDAQRREAFVQAVRAIAPRRRRTRRPIAIGVGLALIAAAIAVVATRDDEGRFEPRPNALGSIQATGAELTGFVDVGSKPVGVAVGAGSLWVTNEEGGTLSRVDESDGGLVQTIQLEGGPHAVVFHDDAVWVSIPENGTVVRINPSTNTAVQTIEVGNDPVDIALSGSNLWVANRSEDSIGHFDISTGRRITRLPVGAAPVAVASGDDVWVAHGRDGTVVRIDPTSHQIIKEFAVGNGPTDIALGDDAVWVTNGLDGTVSRIDPQTSSVEATIPVGNGPRAIALASGAVWITNEYDGSVTKVDAASNTVIDTIVVGNAPLGVAVAEDTVWFVTRAREAGRHRGGTLTYASEGTVDSIDPAIAYSLPAWQILIATNDGLVGFKKVGGADGASIVPNLAVSIPTPGDGGRSYTFELRPDIEYSNGEPLKASDIRASLERVFRVGSPGGVFFDGIVGAADCSRARCDLSQGIIADDASRTVTFHLTAPDPELLYKLALPFAFVLPADTRLKEMTEAGLPATGPYVLDRYEPSKELVLVRNRNFREWSSAAQPDGNVDEIIVKTVPSDDESAPDKNVVAAVESGNADLAAADFGFTKEILDRLLRDYTDRVHIYSTKSTTGMVLNTRVPPFDDVRVRRAINFAVDRAKVVELSGGESRAVLTCQILPPNVPAYRPYCPYTIDSSTGRWTAPDTARAQALVDASDATDVPVEVWDFVGFGGQGKYFVSLLQKLGFQAELRLVSDPSAYFDKVNDSSSRVQMFSTGWIADYPTPSNFLHLLFSCDSFIPDSPINNNGSQLCDRQLDRMMDRALRLDFTNPPAARELWAKVDRRVVDLAPWVPLINSRGSDFTADRVGNYQRHPQWGVLLSQLWVE